MISGCAKHVTIDLTHTTLLPAMTPTATEYCFGRFVLIALRLDRRKKEILDWVWIWLLWVFFPMASCQQSIPLIVFDFALLTLHPLNPWLFQIWGVWIPFLRSITALDAWQALFVASGKASRHRWYCTERWKTSGSLPSVLHRRRTSTDIYAWLSIMTGYLQHIDGAIRVNAIDSTNSTSFTIGDLRNCVDQWTCEARFDRTRGHHVSAWHGTHCIRGLPVPLFAYRPYDKIG